MTAPDRRQFVAALAAFGLGSEPLVWAVFAQGTQTQQSRVTAAMIREAVALAGLKYTEAEQQGMVASLNRILARAEELHQAPPDNDVPSPILFTPRVPGFPVVVPTRVHRPSVAARQTRPANLDDLAFHSITLLADLIRRRVVSSLELTEMYLRRLERYNPSLNCVVNLTADRAGAQARELDAELARGQYRGLLHGIPWGVKDLVSARGAPTTWGATRANPRRAKWSVSWPACSRPSGTRRCARIT